MDEQGKPPPEPAKARAATEARTPGAADAASPAHDEWLIDEALQETFPASDPIRPAQRRDNPAGSRR